MKNHRERAKQVRQRKVAALAAYSREHTVNNCAIPRVDEKSLAIWDANKWYKEAREAAKKAKQEYKYFSKRKKPWYTLDTRKRIHYEERKESYGARVDWFRVQSEAAKMYNKTVFHPNKGCAWYMEQITQCKIAKWERKNPCPVKEDQNPPDIFEQEYIIPWKAKREQALERIRDFVVSMYDKLPLTGRFEKSDNNYSEEQVAEIKDVNMEGHKVNKLDPKKSKLLKKVQKKTNEIKINRPNLICTNLKDHKRQKGRIILPMAA